MQKHIYASLCMSLLICSRALALSGNNNMALMRQVACQVMTNQERNDNFHKMQRTAEHDDYRGHMAISDFKQAYPTYKQQTDDATQQYIGVLCWRVQHGLNACSFVDELPLEIKEDVMHAVVQDASLLRSWGLDQPISLKEHVVRLSGECVYIKTKYLE